MQLTLDIPDDLASCLAAAHGGELGRAAVQHLALAGYRASTLSRYRVQRLLGYDNRWDAEDWLGSRGEAVRYTAADLDDDRASLTRILGR